MAEEFLIDPMSELAGGGWKSSSFQPTLVVKKEAEEVKKEVPVSALQQALEKARAKEEDFKTKTLTSFRGGTNVKQELCQMCIKIHTDVRNAATRFDTEMRRKVYITPKSYLDLMELYKKLLRERRKELGGEREHL